MEAQSDCSSLETNQEVDAKTFASWEVDSVKVDGCNSNSATMNAAYPRFGDFLNATGRPMLYSCSWPDYLNDHVNFSYFGENSRGRVRHEVPVSTERDQRYNRS